MVDTCVKFFSHPTAMEVIIDGITFNKINKLFLCFILKLILRYESEGEICRSSDEGGKPLIKLVVGDVGVWVKELRH